MRHLPMMLLLLAVCGCSVRTGETVQSKGSLVPSLDELSPVWVSVDTVDMEPSLRNFRSQALTNKDMTSLSWLADAPYSGGYHTGTLRVGEETPVVTHFRWQPWQALRKSVQEDYTISSATRMVVDEPVILWDITLDEIRQSAPVSVAIDHIGFMNKFPDREWQWWYPYPTLDSMTTKRDDIIENIRDHIGTGITSAETEVVELINGKPTATTKRAEWPSDLDILADDSYRTEINDGIILVTENTTGVVTGFRLFSATDSIKTYRAGATSYFSLKDNSSRLQYAMAWGSSRSDVLDKLGSIEFESAWEEIETEWKNRWEAIFEPGNAIISGTFPVLETDDKKAERVYYTGPLTMLYLMNTNLPEHDKVFLTGGPRWGASITFFWDITEWSTLWATVDPEMMKQHLRSWVQIDPSSYYGKDNFGGQGVGNGYSANYWALFQMLRSYLTISGDNAFLEEVVDGKTVLEHMDHYATNWKRISIYEENSGMSETFRLADFGDDEWNLLECVPTYKHIVPSFNAGYIWMMRETAGFHRLSGDESRAAELESEAEDMVGLLLDLYAGDGVWYSLYPDGSRIEVRHCLDFMFMGRYLPDDIPESIKKEMMEFVYRELITDHWMRAQSMDDIAAADSDRPDHGPLGAFDGWPAGTMDALAQLGYPEKALDFYHKIEPVTHEGIWAQAHEIWGENKWKPSGKVRIAKRGWHNRESSAGIAMSQVMLKNFFGFYPEVEGDPIRQHENWSFDGTLYHVKYKGDYYTLRSSGNEVIMEKEN